ncbi:hypothetical protein ACFX13_001808 [Malus domestica]
MIVASPRRIAKPSRPSFSSCMGPTSHHTCRPLLYSSQSLQNLPQHSRSVRLRSARSAQLRPAPQDKEAIWRTVTFLILNWRVEVAVEKELCFLFDQPVLRHPFFPPNLSPQSSLYR